MGDTTYWQDEALCAQVSPELFFPDDGDSANPARSICRQCSVVAECLEFAQQHSLRYGIFGGLGPRQRSKLRGRNAA